MKKTSKKTSGIYHKIDLKMEGSGSGSHCLIYKDSNGEQRSGLPIFRSRSDALQAAALLQSFYPILTDFEVKKVTGD